MSLASFETGIKSHLIEVILLAILVFGGVYGVDSIIAKHDAANDAKWSSLLKQVQDKNSVDIANLTALNKSLLESEIQRNTKLSSQQQTDRTLSSPQVAQKLGGTSIDPTTIQLPLPQAQAITAELEAIPVLQADLTDETTIAKNDEKEIADLKTQIQVSDKACQATITKVKADARRSKLRWFLAGVVTGFTLGHVSY